MWGLGFGGLAQSGRHSVGGDVEVLTQELDTLVGEAVVEPRPAEFLLHKASGLEGFHEVQHLQVGDLHLPMLCRGHIFLGNKNALFKEVLINSKTVFLGH